MIQSLHDMVFNPRPKITEAMRLAGETWRKTTSGRWLLVCSTCGSNCGQCGSTDRLGNFDQSADAWADGKSMMANIVKGNGW